MLDPQLLETFRTVARTLNFSRAAEQLGVRQSTVSQHIRKLEAQAGRPLFHRDTHSVVLTADGEAMRGFAQQILDTHERAESYFHSSRVRGRLRFGVGEDVVSSRLPEILQGFRRKHPMVDLELTVALSGVLHERLTHRELDLVFAKRRPDETHGRLLWREPLVWLGSEATSLDPSEPVPLIVYPPPSITRHRAIEVMARDGRDWRVTCTSSSLSGTRAAVLAGLGITLHAHSLIPAGLTPVSPRHGLPDPGDVEFVLLTRDEPISDATAALADAIVSNADQLR